MEDVLPVSQGKQAGSNRCPRCRKGSGEQRGAAGGSSSFGVEVPCWLPLPLGGLRETPRTLGGTGGSLGSPPALLAAPGLRLPLGIRRQAEREAEGGSRSTPSAHGLFFPVGAGEGEVGRAQRHGCPPPSPPLPPPPPSSAAHGKQKLSLLLRRVPPAAPRRLPGRTPRRIAAGGCGSARLLRSSLPGDEEQAASGASPAALRAGEELD